MICRVFIAGALLASTTVAAAASVVDQDALVATHAPGDTYVAGASLAYQPSFALTRLGSMQSVTAGKAGLLSRIDLQLYRSGIANAGLQFSVNIVAGDPGETGPISTIGTFNYVRGDLPLYDAMIAGALFSVDVSSLKFTVSPGQKFSILLTIPELQNNTADYSLPVVSWVYGDEPDPYYYAPEGWLNYAGGAHTYLNDDGSRLTTAADRAFRTYVDVGARVPEPASWAMLIGGFGLIGGYARRRQPRVRFA